MPAVSRPFVDHVRAARAAWPRIPLGDDAFVRHLAELTRDGETPPIEYAGDIFIACACAAGVPNAVDEFERAFSGYVARAVRRVDGAPAFVEDTMQVLRELLFTAKEGKAPRIGQYLGRASLRTWVSAIAVRTAMAIRRRRDDRSFDALHSGNAPVAAQLAPELVHLRGCYKADLEDAIRAAVGALTPRERALLRQHLADRMSIDDLAAFYRIGRSTAARWLAAARDALAHATQAAFCARTEVTPSEFDSVAGALRSDLDVSLVSHLARLDGG